jgi:mono/diheme cytochrome c family protein
MNLLRTFWFRGAAAAALLGGAATAAAGCSVSDQPNYMIAPQINHMAFSKAVESQTESRLAVLGATADQPGRTLLTPPEGTVRRGFKPVHYDVTEEAAKAAGVVDKNGKAMLPKFARAEAERAGKELKNPYAGSDDPAVLGRGEAIFLTFCAPCHGKTGLGDGAVAKRGIPGFPLATKGAMAAKYADGHLFHIITYGRGMMGSYASQIGQDDRWKAIRWLRTLQAKTTPGAGQGG